MSNTTDSHLNAGLRLFWATIPTASRRRTARGRMITCRHLTEHLARARQLRAYVKTEADREAVEGLIAEMEERRDELADNGQLARRVREERERGRDKALRELRSLIRLLEAGSRQAEKNVIG